MEDIDILKKVKTFNNFEDLNIWSNQHGLTHHKLVTDHHYELLFNTYTSLETINTCESLPDNNSNPSVTVDDNDTNVDYMISSMYTLPEDNLIDLLGDGEELIDQTPQTETSGAVAPIAQNPDQSPPKVRRKRKRQKRLTSTTQLREPTAEEDIIDSNDVSIITFFFILESLMLINILISF